MFDLFPAEQANTLNRAQNHPATAADTGTFDNFISGSGGYLMRSMAEAGRAIDLAGSVFPITVDAVTGGTVRQDQYFKEHDEVFNNAVDYWTPRPGEVGTAGQVVGQLAGGILQAVVSPALLVASAGLGTGEDLVREGVDPDTAAKVGLIQAGATAVGVKMPTVGKTLLSRVLSGIGGNVGQGIVSSYASHEVLNDYKNQAERFNPWDVRARVLDAMLGVAFGGMAHLEAKMTPTDQAALLVANQARHLEEQSNGRPMTDADATLHADAMKTAIDQVLKGEDVNVGHIVKDMRTIADDSQFDNRHEVMREAHDVSETMAKYEPDIEVKTPATVVDVAPDASVTSTQARRVILENPDMLVPTAFENADGSVKTIRAADAIAHAENELQFMKSRGAEVFKTAASCLLGVL